MATTRPPLPGFRDTLVRLMGVVCWIEDAASGVKLTYYNGDTLAAATTAAGCPVTPRYIGLCIAGQASNPSALMVDRMAMAFDQRTVVDVSPMLFLRKQDADLTFRRLEDERERLADALKKGPSER